PGEIGAALPVADGGADARGRELVRQVEDDRGRLEDDRAVVAVLDRGHLAVRMRVGGIGRARAVAGAGVDELDLVRRAQFLEQPQETRGTGPWAVIERDHLWGSPIAAAF